MKPWKSGLEFENDLGSIWKATSLTLEVGHDYTCHHDHFLHCLVLEQVCTDTWSRYQNPALDRTIESQCYYCPQTVQLNGYPERVDKALQSSPMARGSGSTDRNRPGASGPHGDDTMAFIVFSTPCTSIGSIVHSALYIVHCN